MDRLAHDVVNAAVEQSKRSIERRLVAHGDDRRLGAVTDCPRQLEHAVPLSDQECLDGMQIAVGCRAHPFGELCRIEARRGNALAPKKRSVAIFHELALVNHYDHSSASESVVVFL